MNFKISPTEELKKTYKTIDKLNTYDGIRLLLEDQKNSISAIKKVMNDISNCIDQMFLRLKMSDTGRLIYAGAGTSGRIAIQDGVELLPTFGWPENRLEYIMAGGEKAVFKSVEFAEDDVKNSIKIVEKLNINFNDVVIGVAASGNTPFTCKIIEKAKAYSAMTIAITNNPNGAILNFADNKIILETNGEIIAGSTRMKAGTSQKICLNLISTMLMVKMGKVKNGLMTEMVPTNSKLIERKNKIKALIKS